MTEQGILHLIPERMKQLHYSRWHIRYRDITIQAGEMKIIPAYNELYFIVDDPQGFIIESDYGVYDSSGTDPHDNIHQHRGEITLLNVTAHAQRIKLIQVIIVN